jgi:peptidoglycan/LPS O-acetylase OafA/YrhL
MGRIVTVIFFGPGPAQLYTRTRLDRLLFGVILAYLMYDNRQKFDRLLEEKRMLWLAGLLPFVVAIVAGAHSPYMATIEYTINYIDFGALMLAIHGYQGHLVGTGAYRIMAWIGRYSYEIYLWHLSVREPLAHLAEHLDPRVGWVALLVAQYVCAIILGVLVTEIVEFPMLKVRDRLFPRGPAHLPPTNPICASKAVSARVGATGVGGVNDGLGRETSDLADCDSTARGRITGGETEAYVPRWIN